MNIGIIYASITGNTKVLAELIHQHIQRSIIINRVDLYHVKEFSFSSLAKYDAIAIGTYTWGNGEIPKEMDMLFKAIEKNVEKNVATGVFGTGDSFYPKFCGAVDVFRDMLAVRTNLAVTLKVELLPQQTDDNRCLKFSNILLKRLLDTKGLLDEE